MARSRVAGRLSLPQVIDCHDDEATQRCEHLIRNHDPCLRCATHFLKLRVGR